MRTVSRSVRVEKADTGTGGGHRSGEGDVFDDLAGHGRHAAAGEERLALDGHALTVRHRRGPAGCRPVPGGPNRYTSVVSIAACSQRAGRVGHSNRPATVSRSNRVGAGPVHQARGQARVGSGVGIERDDPLGGRREQPLLERPRLARPSGGQRLAHDHDARAELAPRSRRPVARLVVDDDHLAHARRADDPIEQRTDRCHLVPRRHDDRDRARSGRRCGDRLAHRSSCRPMSHRARVDRRAERFGGV